MSSEEISQRIQTVIENAEVGDLLEIDRGLYNHWAVYIGNYEVVHLTGVRGTERIDQRNQGNFFIISGIEYKKAAAKREHVSNVVMDSDFRVNNDTCKKCRVRPVEEIKETALAFTELTYIEYHVLRRNCEHFATYCRYDMAFSKQSNMAQVVFYLSVIGAFFLAYVCAFYRYD